MSPKVRPVVVKPIPPKIGVPPLRNARIALVQLDYNPSYRYRINYLIEPSPGKDISSNTAMSTLTLADQKLNELIKTELHRMRVAYLQTLTQKINSILHALENRGIDLVCFPEYCVPAEIISDLLPWSRHFALVLPSHIASASTLRLLADTFDCDELPWQSGQALYVALERDGNAYVCPKVTRSKFEASLIPGTEVSPLPLLGRESSVVVAMCSDFLDGRTGGQSRDIQNPILHYLDSATLRVVCSFTPSTAPFFEIATQDLLRGMSLNRRPTAFVNHSEEGGTSLFALMESEQVLDPVSGHCSYQIPSKVEAVAVYDVSLGPQLDVRPSSTSAEWRSSLVGLNILAQPSAATGGTLGRLCQIYQAANAGVQENISKSLASLGELATPALRQAFAPLDLSLGDSVLRWRQDTAHSMYQLLTSIRPSVDALDRKALDLRLDALEELVGSRTQNAIRVAADGPSVSPAVTGQKHPMFNETVGAECYRTAVLRLTSISQEAPIERVVGPVWALITSVERDPRISFEIRYEIIGAGKVGQDTVLHEFTIEVFVVARYRMTDLDSPDRAESVLLDVSGLLRTGYGNIYRFSPVSEALWQKYADSQAMEYRITAGHSTRTQDGQAMLVPYRGHPQIAKVLRFLYSRGEAASLVLSISHLSGDQVLYLPALVPEYPLQGVSQKTEESLEAALSDLRLLTLLQSPSPRESEVPHCNLAVSLSLPTEPNAVVTEVVLHELLGDDFCATVEQRSGDTWKYHVGESSPLHQQASVRECLMLLRFPVGSLPTFGDRTAASTLQVPLEVIEDRDGCLIGHAFHPDATDSIPVFVSNLDRRKHLYLIGKTGTGKTQMLLNMIMQDIEKGRGLCVIDPHGDLYEDIVDRYPVHRLRDLITFDPTDAENPPGLNLFEYDRQNPMQRDFVLDEAVSIFLRLHGYEMFGPRIQNYFRSGTLALMSDPGRERTLLDVARLFLDDKFFDYIMSSAVDPVVVDFLSEFKKTAEREKTELLPYFQAKFTPFVSNSILRHVIGQQRSSVNFRQAMDQSKVVLVNLSKGKLGELNSRLLGMVLVSKITWAALSRAQISPEQRSDFFLYCDEFQSFATDSFNTILSEARKYGLCLTLAHQHLSQLHITDNFTNMPRSSLRDAVLGNVGNLVFFRMGASDAEELSKEISGDARIRDRITPLLCTLERFHAIAKLDCGGLPTRPFTMQSLLTASEVNVERGVSIREYVAKQNLLPKAFVSGDIASSRTDYERS